MDNTDSAILSVQQRSAWLSRLEINDRVKGPLLTAIASADVGIALELLESGQASKKDLRSKDIKLPTGLTALHLAALFGDAALVTQLLEKNADAGVSCFCEIKSHSIANKFWMDARPLLLAIGAKNRLVVEQLLAHSTSVDMNDAWPLFSGEWWRLTGRFDWKTAHEILRLLVHNKLDLNQKVSLPKWTMLHYCVNMEPKSRVGIEEFLQGRYTTIEYLIQNAADPLLKDTFGRTPYALLDERSARDHLGDEDRDLVVLKRDADMRLKELLQRSMIVQVDRVKSQPGIKGSLRKVIVRGKDLDRIPLLSRYSSSLWSSSVVSFGGRSRQSEVAMS